VPGTNGSLTRSKVRRVPRGRPVLRRSRCSCRRLAARRRGDRRSRFDPGVQLILDPGDGIRSEPPSAREVSCLFHSIDGHAGQARDVHDLADAQQFHDAIVFWYPGRVRVCCELCIGLMLGSEQSIGPFGRNTAEKPLWRIERGQGDTSIGPIRGETPGSAPWAIAKRWDST
jgi:hypothetical protein